MKYSKQLILPVMVIILIIVILISKIPALSAPGTKMKDVGIWLHSDMFSSDVDTATQQLQQTLNNYIKIGINNIFCVRSMMDEHQKGWDFLAVLLKEAHARAIKVHPKIDPGREVKLLGKIRENPEWLIKGKKGELYTFLNLANPAVKKYWLERIARLLAYEIDGIHLDYIRFPVHQNYSYDDATCAAFKNEYGFTPLEVIQDCGSIVWCEWIKWNTKHITALVKDIKTLIKNSGKNILLSAAVFPDPEISKVQIGQDWALWVKKGIVDIICPMLYINAPEIFESYAKSALSHKNSHCLIYIGIAAKSSHNQNTPQGLEQQVKIAQEAGADGIVFFSGYSVNEDVINWLEATVFQTRK